MDGESGFESVALVAGDQRATGSLEVFEVVLVSCSKSAITLPYIASRSKKRTFSCDRRA